MIRRTLFSASCFSRRRLCPGSLAMEEGLPNVESEWSAEGTLLHHAAATGDMTGLTPEQEEIVKEKLVVRDQFLESLGFHGCKIGVEVELGYFREPRKALFWSHADLVVANESVAAVIDYKFGYEEVDAPELNEQLGVYIACVAERVKVNEYYGLIIPRFGKPAPPVKYTRDEIPALREIIQEVYDACTPTAPRTPGLKQCAYCKGFQLGLCKESIAMAMNPVNKFSAKLLANPGQVLQSLKPDDRTKLFDAFAMADKLRKTFVAAVKPMIERDSEFVPGYKLSREGETRTKVTDMLALERRMQDELGMTCLDVCTISNKALTDVVRDTTGLKGKALSERVEQLVAGLVDTTPVERSLERI